MTYTDHLNAWESGRGPLPTQCAHTKGGYRCNLVEGHQETHRAVEDVTARPAWRISWTDRHGRARIMQVRRDVYGPAEALGILSAAFHSSIRSVDDVEPVAI